MTQSKYHNDNPPPLRGFTADGTYLEADSVADWQAQEVALRESQVIAVVDADAPAKVIDCTVRERKRLTVPRMPLGVYPSTDKREVDKYL